jgi:hypothetical protein
MTLINVFRNTGCYNNSALTEIVASLVGRHRLDDVLTVTCCSLHTRYFSIHVGSFSMDDEPATDVRDRRSPSRRGRSGDGVGEDMAGQSRQGSREAATRTVRARSGSARSVGDRVPRTCD